MPQRFPSNRENERLDGNAQRRGADGAAGEAQFDVEDGFRRKLKEQDPHRLAQRQKALDKGKNTRAYQNYLRQVPKRERPEKKNEEQFPNTPDKGEVCSTRAWNGKVRHWRLRLHRWDPAPEEGEEFVEIPTQTFRGIKKAGGVQPPGAKRERDAAGGATPEPPLCKRQSVSGRAASAREGSAASVPAAQEQEPEPEQEEAVSAAKGAAERCIFDDWDEDIAL